MLRRPRLDDLYGSLLEDYQVVAVIGSAGSGKTIQAQLFSEQWGSPYCWVTLDRRDSSPARLLSLLAQTLQPHCPTAVEVVQGALRAGYDSDEAAVLLAESTSDRDLLVVVDECEWISNSTDAAHVLVAFVGHLSPGVQVLMLSREEIPAAFARLQVEDRLAVVTDEDLRLNHDEAAAVLASRNRSVDAAHAVEVTGGWVAGVAFWPESDTANRRRPVDLSNYLRAEILDRLDEEEGRFLLDTSILDVVTPQAAAAICDYDIGPLWSRVVQRHLPSTTMGDGALVYHPVFRAFLRHQLEELDPARHEKIKRTYADFLGGRGYYEEATELYLALGDLDSAARSAELALERVLARADWTAVLHWTEAIDKERVRQSPRLLAAHLRALHGTRHFDEARRLVREGERMGWFRLATDADPELLATMAWTMQDEPAEATRLLDTYRGDYRADAVRFMIAASSGVEPAVPPRGAGWDELERLVSWGLLIQGRLNDLAAAATEEGPVVNTTLILALLSKGDLDEAWRMWDRVPDQVRNRAQTHFVKALLLMASYDYDAGFKSMEEALTECRESGFGLYPVYVVFTAWLHLCRGQLEEALAVLEEVMPTVETEGKRFLVEWGQLVMGMAYLGSGRVREAELILSEAVHSMRRSRRLLLVPLAAAYLSEAQEQQGANEAAAASAALALETAEATGAFHWLLVALRELPTVLDRESIRPVSGERWLRLPVWPPHFPTAVSGTHGSQRHVELQPFGPHPDLVVNGRPLQIGRMKVMELVAYLSLHPEGVDRRELQRNLFQDVDQRRGGNHFRQIVHKLHRSAGLRLDRGAKGEVRLPEDVILETTDAKFERLVRQAADLTGKEKLDHLNEALSLVCGDYLERSDLPWVDQRRYQIDVAREEALTEVMRLSTELDDIEGVRKAAEELLQVNPFSSDAYRCLIRAERASGSEASYMAVYRRGVRAFQELAVPADEIREILGAADLRSSDTSK